MSIIAYHGAPVLGHVKPASLINIKKNMNGYDVMATWDFYKMRIKSHLSVDYCELNRTDTHIQVLFYHKGWLSDLLSEASHLNFLSRFFYTPQMTLEQKLGHLCLRYERACPHEIGLFLGYPLSDVQTFCDAPCSPCLAIGYWKVYSDVDTAQATFNAYDNFRHYALNLMNSGVRPSHVVLKKILSPQMS